MTMTGLPKMENLVGVEAAPTARLTIGMPTYNNETTLQAALESLLSQSYRNLVIHVSDDGSKDDTAELADKFALLDARVSVTRQPKNLRYQNFGHLLRDCHTEFFMWAAGDDWWAPDFAARCIELLDDNPEAFLAVPRIEFVDPATGVVTQSKATRSLTGSWSERLAQYLSDPSDNSRMYGVMRTAWAKQCFPSTSFHAYDWAFVAASLKFGSHLEVDETLMRRDLTPMPKYYDMVQQDNKGLIPRLFPMLPMSAWLLTNGFIGNSPKVFRRLVSLNWSKHRHMVRHLGGGRYQLIRAVRTLGSKAF